MGGTSPPASPTAIDLTAWSAAPQPAPCTELSSTAPTCAADQIGSASSCHSCRGRGTSIRTKHLESERRTPSMNNGLHKLLRRLHPQGIPWPGSVLYSALSSTAIFRHHYQLVAQDFGRYCREGRILDVGTGPGWLLLEMHRAFPQAHLVGVDISPAMARKAKSNIEKAGLPERIEVLEASAAALPFPDNSFDGVVSTASIHHWKDRGGGLREICRVLRPGRHAVICDLVRDLPPAVLAQLQREVGRFRTVLLKLHSFEEPFLNTQEFESLAAQTPFEGGTVYFLGAFCCHAMRKKQDA